MSATDLTLCDGKQIGKPTDIVICDNQQVGKPSDIKFCDKEQASQDPCAGLSSVHISGTDTPVEGSIYSAGGGRSPYSFSISSGSINSETGQITAVGCGSATVSVVDDCGSSASLVVRFASGQWVFSHGECEDGSEYSTSSGCPTTPYYHNNYQPDPIGDTKVVVAVASDCCLETEPVCPPDYDNLYDIGVTGDPCQRTVNGAPVDGTVYTRWYAKVYSTWECL